MSPQEKLVKMRSALEAVRRRRMVRFERPYEEGWIDGYVLLVGPEFFLLALVTDQARFNGLLCLRLQDVRKLEIAAGKANLMERALKLRGLKIPTAPRIDLSSIESLLATAGPLYPVVTIHRERANPDICHIGHVVAVDGKKLQLLEIDPKGVWDDASETYRLKEITQVGLGGGYEEALILVGGLPPRS